MRENISIYTRLRTVVTCTNRNVCNNKKENFISENSYKVRPFILEMDF